MITLKRLAWISSLTVLVIMGAAFFAYYEGATSLLSNQSATISSLQDRIHSLEDTTPSVTTIVRESTETLFLTSSITVTTTVSTTKTITQTFSNPLNSSWYLNNSPSCSGPNGYGVCFGGNLSIAVVFNCGSSAASPTGCTTTVNSSAPPHPGYSITIWYPKTNQPNEPSWANCEFSVPSDYIYNSPGFCISLSTSSFIIAKPAPGPI